MSPAAEVLPRVGRGTTASTETGNSEPMSWTRLEELLTGGGWFWLATVRPDGAPHVRPVFAVWAESALYVSSKDSARKSKNLEADGRCTVSTDTGGAHLVVEGTARRISDADTLQLASAAYDRIYGWPTVVTDGKLDAEYGAPTSGGPPYDVYQIVPHTVYGFPTDGESFAPTRWRPGSR